MFEFGEGWVDKVLIKRFVGNWLFNVICLDREFGDFGFELGLIDFVLIVLNFYDVYNENLR